MRSGNDTKLILYPFFNILCEIVNYHYPKQIVYFVGKI